MRFYLHQHPADNQAMQSPSAQRHVQRRIAVYRIHRCSTFIGLKRQRKLCRAVSRNNSRRPTQAMDQTFIVRSPGEWVRLDGLPLFAAHWRRYHAHAQQIAAIDDAIKF